MPRSIRESLESQLLSGLVLVLSEVMACETGFGKVIHGDRRATLKVKLSSLVSMVRKEIKNLSALLAGNSPPELVLNRHCAECEFQDRCYKKAKETDDLSLLSGMSKKSVSNIGTEACFR
jgi:predicted RecB family nuclease